MLEKIGLPPKPSLRGNIWVVDASHCQGCSSQFTFINRKHHCRRCGGLFCNSCTQQRMVLRGQGDSPVRICDPCKNLEEAARFEMRHGHKNRSGKGGSRLTSKHEDEVLNQILGKDGKESFSSGRESTSDTVSSIERSTSSASCSELEELSSQDMEGQIVRSLTVNEPNHVPGEMGSINPEELRQQALDEKRKYKILKGEGKSEEALKAFKRGKELERQAGALEISLRKSRKRALSSSNIAENQKIMDGPKESGRKNRLLPQMGKEKDDLAAELRELGWSDRELHDADKKPVNISLEGELSTLLREVPQKTNTDKETHGIDKSEVIALKKKALMLKREGKLIEAKEELKRAKLLEKQLEEQEFLAEAEDSDDEISSLIRSIDNDKQGDFSIGYNPVNDFDFDHLVGMADDIGLDGNFEAMDEDMDDPEMAAALKSLGWSEDSHHPVDIVAQSAPIDRDTLLHEIQSLKREALNEKRGGNTSVAMVLLKKAKVLERDLDGFDSQGDNSSANDPAMFQKGSTSQTADNSLMLNKADNKNVNGMKIVEPKMAPKSKLMIQKELLGLKKKALALRREGRLDEAEEELKKGKVLEQQLEEMDNASKVKFTQVNVSSKHPDISGTLNLGDVGEEGDVTDQDLNDPMYLSLLSNMGWKDEDNETVSFPSKSRKQNDSLSTQIADSSIIQAPTTTPVGASRRSKGEIQRELLGLKRKALALRRQGETEEAEEVLRLARVLEAQISEMEAPTKEAPVENKYKEDKAIKYPLESSSDKGDEGDATEKDLGDPVLLSMQKNLGWKDKDRPETTQAEPFKQNAGIYTHSTDPSVIQYNSEVPVISPRKSKGEIQRELLGLKRKALTLRRQGKTEEAEEVLRNAKILEAQMDMEAPRTELLLDPSKDKDLESFESLITTEKHGSMKDVVEVNKQSVQAVVDPTEKVVEWATSSGLKESETVKPPSTSSGLLIPEMSQIVEGNNPLLVDIGPPGKMGISEGTYFVPPSDQSGNIMDLLTGDEWNASHVPSEKQGGEWNLSSGISSFANPPLLVESLKSTNEDLGSKVDAAPQKREEMVDADRKLDVSEANSGQAIASQKNKSSIQQEILSHKRKAVSLKREGKLAEARDELRQAKLLEKNLEEDDPQPRSSASDTSISSFSVTSIGQRTQTLVDSAPKMLSGRDRFELQQESLSHKRSALKLRREGRIEEAEAEFELAKALETQLEELAAHDAAKSSAKGAEPVDDVHVDDLLDPQLLSALKAIGLEDASPLAQSPEKPEPAKLHISKSDSSSQEKSQLEERIKAEKVKAVNLKRAGKQAEALDALRRAKMFEKKLNSLTS